MADDKVVFKEGDIVFYENELYRANVCDHANDIIYIVNINSIAKVSAADLTYVGEDTLSAIAVKELKPVKIKYRWRAGDFVRNDRLGLSGEVLENRDGKTKVEVYLDDGGFKLYWWPQSEMTTDHNLYKGPNQGLLPPSDFDQKYGVTPRERWDSERRALKPVPPTRSYTPMGAPKEPKPKPPSLGISTSALIKKEVSKLENEQKSKPLRTNAPTKKKDSGIFDGPSKPVPKRKGDW